MPDGESVKVLHDGTSYGFSIRQQIEIAYPEYAGTLADEPDSILRALFPEGPAGKRIIEVHQRLIEIMGLLLKDKAEHPFRGQIDLPNRSNRLILKLTLHSFSSHRYDFKYFHRMTQDARANPFHGYLSAAAQVLNFWDVDFDEDIIIRPAYPSVHYPGLEAHLLSIWRRMFSDFMHERERVIAGLPSGRLLQNAFKEEEYMLQNSGGLRLITAAYTIRACRDVDSEYIGEGVLGATDLVIRAWERYSESFPKPRE